MEGDGLESELGAPASFRLGFGSGGGCAALRDGARLDVGVLSVDSPGGGVVLLRPPFAGAGVPSYV